MPISNCLLFLGLSLADVKTHIIAQEMYHKKKVLKLRLKWRLLSKLSKPKLLDLHLFSMLRTNYCCC